MKNIVAVTKSVGSSLADCELTFVGREPINIYKAIEQHKKYCDALRDAGAAVEVLPPDDNLPDSVFVEDTAIVLDEVAVITRPGTEVRRGEIPMIAQALRKHRQLETIEAPGTIDGGDVLRIGKKIFVGISRRTNQEGYAQFSAVAGRYGYEAIPVKVTGSLHLKTAVTALNDDTILANKNWFDLKQFGGFGRVITVPDDEPFGANTLSLGGTVHISARWPKTREMLEQMHFRVRALDITELEKAEAGLTCLSLIFSKNN